MKVSAILTTLMAAGIVVAGSPADRMSITDITLN